MVVIVPGDLQDDRLVVLHSLLGHVVDGAQLGLIDGKNPADRHDAGQGQHLLMTINTQHQHQHNWTSSSKMRRWLSCAKV